MFYPWFGVCSTQMLVKIYNSQHLLNNDLFIIIDSLGGPANACLRMHSHGQKQQRIFENDKKVPFSLCAREAHERPTKRPSKKNEKKSCWSAIGSDSKKLVDT